MMEPGDGAGEGTMRIDDAAQPPFESLRGRREAALFSPLVPPTTVPCTRAARACARRKLTRTRAAAAGLARLAAAEHRRVRPEPARAPHVQPVRYDAHLRDLPLGLEPPLDAVCLPAQGARRHALSARRGRPAQRRAPQSNPVRCVPAVGSRKACGLVPDG